MFNGIMFKLREWHYKRHGWPGEETIEKAAATGDGARTKAKPRVVYKSDATPRQGTAAPGGVIAAAATGGPMPIIFDLGEKGTTGLPVSGGRIYEDYNLDLQDLSVRMARYEEMYRSNAAMKTIRQLLYMPLQRARWEIKPGDGDKSDSGADLAKKFHDNLFAPPPNGMLQPWSNILANVVDAVLYGFTVTEMCWEIKPNGMLGFMDLADRERTSVDKWLFDGNGRVTGFHQRAFRPNYEGEMVDRDISMNDVLIWTWDKRYGNPEGLGLMRHCWKPHRFKEVMEQLAMMRIERQALGVWVARPREGREITETEAAEAHSIIANIRGGEAVGLVETEDWTFEVVWPGPGDVPWQDMIERQHQYVLQTMLAQFVGFSQGGDKGSFGLSQDASSMFLMALSSVADWVCDYFNWYAIPQLIRMNDVNPRVAPRLQHGPIGLRDVGTLGTLLRSIFGKDVVVPRDQLNFALSEVDAPLLDEEQYGKFRELAKTNEEKLGKAAQQVAAQEGVTP